MNLLTEHKETHRLRKWTYGCREGDIVRLYMNNHLSDQTNHVVICGGKKMNKNNKEMSQKLSL